MDEYGFALDVMEAGDAADGRAVERAFAVVDGQDDRVCGPWFNPEFGPVHGRSLRPWDTGR